MGKVESVIEGKDGLVRGAALKVIQRKTNKFGLIRRPLQLLILLEIKDKKLSVHQEKKNEKIVRESRKRNTLGHRPKRLAAANADLIRQLGT